MPAIHHPRRPRASPLWQIVHHAAEPAGDLFDQRPDSGKPVEIRHEDGSILVLDLD